MIFCSPYQCCSPTIVATLNTHSVQSQSTFNTGQNRTINHSEWDYTVQARHSTWAQYRIHGPSQPDLQYPRRKIKTICLTWFQQRALSTYRLDSLICFSITWIMHWSMLKRSTSGAGPKEPGHCDDLVSHHLKMTRVVTQQRMFLQRERCFLKSQCVQFSVLL